MPTVNVFKNLLKLEKLIEKSFQSTAVSSIF